MFRLTRSFSRFQKPNLMRFSSSIRTDDDLTGDDLAGDSDAKQRRPNQKNRKLDVRDGQGAEFGNAKEQEEFFSDIARVAKSKQELASFRDDLNKLTLAECLQKYECSIRDALQLDPSLQKRILIKVSGWNPDCVSEKQPHAN